MVIKKQRISMWQGGHTTGATLLYHAEDEIFYSSDAQAFGLKYLLD
jgi:hypothetical protein